MNCYGRQFREQKQEIKRNIARNGLTVFYIMILVFRENGKNERHFLLHAAFLTWAKITLPKYGMFYF